MPAYEYLYPKITNVSVFRCNADGTRNDSGIYASISATAKIAPITVDGEDKNGIDEFVYTLVRAGVTPGPDDEVDIGDSDILIVALPGTDVAMHSYEIAMRLKDNVGNETSITNTISTAQIAFNIKEGGRGAAFGKYAETDECLEVDYDLQLLGKIVGRDITSAFTLSEEVADAGAGANIIIYYPCLSMVYARIHVLSAVESPVNIGVVHTDYVNNANALSAFANNTSKAFSHLQSDGTVTFYSETDIGIGKHIYINGFWFV